MEYFTWLTFTFHFTDSLLFILFIESHHVAYIEFIGLRALSMLANFFGLVEFCMTYVMLNVIVLHTFIDFCTHSI